FIRVTDSDSKKPRRSGILRKAVKLTDKPLSFGYSVVDSHSSASRIQIAKTPPERGFDIKR
ncbi:TPA: hypothetical protein ACXPX9_005086, partial [Klebsiella quasipneumoniae subsp. quasipneumoniae]